VANGNGIVPLSMLGVTGEYGTIRLDQLETALLSVKRSEPSQFVVEDIQVTENFISCGRTLEQVQRYKDTLIRILNFCIEEQCELNWA